VEWIQKSYGIEGKLHVLGYAENINYTAELTFSGQDGFYLYAGGELKLCARTAFPLQLELERHLERIELPQQCMYVFIAFIPSFCSPSLSFHFHLRCRFLIICTVLGGLLLRSKITQTPHLLTHSILCLMTRQWCCL
jgi:hypothetical protein